MMPLSLFASSSFVGLTLLTFLGEAVRDAFDPRRQLNHPSTPELP